MRRKTILHVFNMFWLGGVPMFVRDVMRCYPQFHHVVNYCWERSGFGGEDFDMMHEWQYEVGADIGFGPKLSPKIVEAVDPAVIILNNIGEENLEGEWPYEWLNKRPTIFVHHMGSYPLLKVDLDVFVSKMVLDKYKCIMDRMKKVVLCPPIIDTARFAAIPRAKEDKQNIHVGKLSSDWNKKKYPQMLLNIAKRVVTDHPKAEFSIVGGAKHYKSDQSTKIAFPRARTFDVGEFLADLDIMVYVNEPDLPESWCRVVSEAMAAGLPVVGENRGGIAEQIDHGENGLLATTEDEFVAAVDKLIKDPELRYSLGQRARVKAVREFGLGRFRDATMDVVIRALQ